MAAEPTPLPDHSSVCRIPPSDSPYSGEENVVARMLAVVWKKPSGGDTTPNSHVIADEDSWPALSEATKILCKPSVDSPPPLSTSQGNLISIPKKNRNHIHIHANTNQNHKANTNRTTMPARQRSKRGGSSGSGPSLNSINHYPRPLPLPRPSLPPPPAAALRTPSPPPLPPYPIYEVPFGPLPPPMPFFIPPSFNSNNWERRPVGGFPPQPTPLNDQSFQRNSNPRGNYVGRPRGDGAANNGHVSRRDRSGSHKGFARPSRSQAPPPPRPPYFPMPSTRFLDPVRFDMAFPYVNFQTPPPEFFMRFPPPLPLFVPPIDPALPSQLIRQIDHYFSDDNLAKDSYLRSRMDNEGWVDIAFIAAFPMVQRMTQNLQLIVDSLKVSDVVEIQGNHIRRRNDWRKWILSATRSSISSSSPNPAGSVVNTLTYSIQNVNLEDGTSSINVVTCDGKDDSCSIVAHSDVAN